MADEEAGTETQPSGGKSKLLIIVLAAVLVLGAGAAAAVYFIVLPKLSPPTAGEATSGASEKQAAQEPVASLGETIELAPFIVNLSGSGGRYLKATMVLQLSTADVSAEINDRGPQIKDAVITVLSSKAADEILTVQGKYDLKVEIMKRINSFLATGVVRELYFVEFVVQ